MHRVCVATGVVVAGAALVGALIRLRAKPSIAASPSLAAPAPRLRLLVIHGLGMDKRGYVDVDKWGTTTLAQYNEAIMAWAERVCVVMCCGCGCRSVRVSVRGRGSV